jgi:hypothetical protein
MRLHQNQLWRQGLDLYRIVHLERLAVEYKKLDPDDSAKGTRHRATKKEFCRLIKGAEEVKCGGTGDGCDGGSPGTIGRKARAFRYGKGGK